MPQLALQSLRGQSALAEFELAIHCMLDDSSGRYPTLIPQLDQGRWRRLTASRQSAGDVPVIFLNVRLNAASDAYPTSWATAAIVMVLSTSRRAASCMRHCVR